MITDYSGILIFMIIAFGLSTVIVFLPFIVSLLLRQYSPNKEKNSPYECGFEAVDSVSNRFNIKFYLVGILFLIFDLEIAFLFPWAIGLRDIGVIGYSSMMIFLFTVTAGFLYEWKKGALNW